MQQGIPDTVNSKWYNKEWLQILIHLLYMDFVYEELPLQH